MSEILAFLTTLPPWLIAILAVISLVGLMTYFLLGGSIGKFKLTRGNPYEAIKFLRPEVEKKSFDIGRSMVLARFDIIYMETEDLLNTVSRVLGRMLEAKNVEPEQVEETIDHIKVFAAAGKTSREADFGWSLFSKLNKYAEERLQGADCTMKIKSLASSIPSMINSAMNSYGAGTSVFHSGGPGKTILNRVDIMDELLKLDDTWQAIVKRAFDNIVEGDEERLAEMLSYNDSRETQAFKVCGLKRAKK